MCQIFDVNKIFKPITYLILLIVSIACSGANMNSDEGTSDSDFVEIFTSELRGLRRLHRMIYRLDGADAI